MASIRAETAADYHAVHEVNERAFERSAEADLVDRLRLEAVRYISLVVVEEGRVVGHIFFSPVEVHPGHTSLNAMGLAPMAVLPEFQRMQAGSSLVREGLQACAKGGIDAVFVLGHPAFYPRFGFEPAKQRGFTCEYDVPDEAFMVKELKPGILKNHAGRIEYHPAFNSVE